MLIVGLTGSLGSGKSTVARLFAGFGANVLSSDEIGRELMQPGQNVYERIVQAFGPTVVREDGQLDRPALSRLAFDSGCPRVEELNAIVHPAVIAEQGCRVASIGETDPQALVVIESALIFTTTHGGGPGKWRSRFDQVIVVVAPEAVAIARYVARVRGERELSREEEARLQEDAWARLEAQRMPPGAAAGCVVIDNSGSYEALAYRTEEVFRQLRKQADDTL